MLSQIHKEMQACKQMRKTNPVPLVDLRNYSKNYISGAWPQNHKPQGCNIIIDL